MKGQQLVYDTRQLMKASGELLHELQRKYPDATFAMGVLTFAMVKISKSSEYEREQLLEQVADVFDHMSIQRHPLN